MRLFRLDYPHNLYHIIFASFVGRLILQLTFFPNAAFTPSFSSIADNYERFKFLIGGANYRR
jgi:hypothetical protein